MDYRIILTKIITLIYRSRTINSTENDDLIRTILQTIKSDSPEFNFNGHNVIKKLKEFAQQLLDEKDIVAKEVIIPQISIILENDNKLLNVLKESIEVDYDEATSKRVIISSVKLLNNVYKEHLATEILSKLSYDLKFNRSKIPNFSEYLKQGIANLEPLTNLLTTIKDPALVNEIDFANLENLNTVFEEVKNLNNNSSIYKTGWQAFNKMCQGGIRRGEYVSIGALQHKFKTGASLSLFMQIARHNKPIVLTSEVGKKPLLLRISFEDSLTGNLQFMYQYLKAHDNITITSKDFENVSSSEMSSYIIDKLTATGFHIKMMRVDPSQWTYSSVINKVIELEAQGYSIHILMLDYALLLPTVGCTMGPLGADKKDMLRRFRNFCSARNITFITPLQLSSEAKMMIRNGVPEHNLVNETAEKGYYDGCKTLDADIDLEIQIHLFNHKGKKYLAVRRGKHRIPTVIAEELKYFMLKFPSLNTPILEDIGKEDSSFTKLPKSFESDSGGGLLDEVLN